MPKPDKDAEDKIDDPQIIVNKDDDPEDKVEVDLNKKPEDKKDEPQFVTQDDFKKAQNRAEYLDRKNAKRMEQILQEVQTTRAAPPAAPPPKDNGSDTRSDKINKVAENNWQEGVGMLVEDKLDTYLRMRKEEDNRKTQKVRNDQIIEEVKQEVLERYPDIEVDGSESNRRFVESFKENSQKFANNPYADRLIIQEMEKKMLSEGVHPPPFRDTINRETDKEVQRRTRVGASALPAGKAVPRNSVMLTQAEIDMADNLNVSRAEFAKMHKLGEKNFKEGVSVDE